MSTDLTKFADASVALTETMTNLSLTDEQEAAVLNLLDLLTPGSEGDEDAASGRVSVSYLKLRQATTNVEYMPEDTPIGGFFTSMGENLGEELHVIPLYKHTVASLFPDEEKPEHEGLERCNSLDGKTGSTYGECKTCPHGRYVPGQNSPCNRAIRMYVVTTDLGFLIRIDFYRTNRRAGKLMQQLARPKLWSKSFKLFSTQEEATIGGKKVRYHAMKASVEGPVDAQTAEICANLMKVIREVRLLELASNEEYLASRASEESQTPSNGKPAIDVPGTTVVGDSEDDALDLGGAL